MKRKKGYFSISAVASMLSVHQQTIRMYEKEGLIAPKRSDGNTRLFSEEDIDKLEEIIYLTHKVGVNMIGVETILRLQKKIETLQEEVNKLFQQTQGQLQEETSTYKQEIKQHISDLHALKKQKAIKLENEEKKEHQNEVDEWKIEYE